MDFLRPSGALAALTVALACSGAPARPPCAEGNLEVCACDSGASGLRECDASGAFGACVCDGEGSGGSGTGGSGTGGSETASGGTPGTGGSTTGGGTSTGGAPSTGGAESGECEHTIVACAYTTAEYPDEATLKDEQSARSESGYFCTNDDVTTWVREEQCPYTQECSIVGADDSACVPCGDISRRTAKRQVDDVITEDCEGCSCPFWRILSCTTSTSEHGEPFVNIYFQSGSDVFSFDLGASGETWTVFPDASVDVSNVDVDISSGGLIELDVLVEFVANSGEEDEQTWQLEGHVVGECEE